MSKAIRKPPFLLSVLFAFAVLVCFSINGICAQDRYDEFSSDRVLLVIGELTTLSADGVTRLSITDPNVADIVEADEEEILLIGREPGQTTLFVWDAQGKRNILVTVVNSDPEFVKDRIDALFETADIHELTVRVSEKEGKVIVSGEIPEKKRDQFDKIILNFSDDVVDLVKDEDVEDLVQIDLQITELNETLTKSLGIDWISGGAFGGDGSTETTGGGMLNLTYTEDLPTFDGSIGDFFKIGDFRRTAVLQANVNALLEQGKGRILSEPKLVVVSGEEASFLVGGEVPIRTTTSSEGAVQENVEFKEFGISMTMTPTIRKGNKIDVIVGVEVSDIDAANAVGEDVAFSTREADTRLFLNDGQTIIIAGLIREQENEVVKKVPFLGEVPVLGLLFRSRGNVTPNQDQELVIMMTPHIIRSSDDKESEDKRIVDSQGTIAKYASKAKPYYSGIPAEMRNYIVSVQDKISRSLAYPPEAAQYGWEGTVKVNMLILQDGTLAFALVRESSGFDVIDDHALEIAKANAPYSSFPPQARLQELNVTIPIVYSLNGR